MGCPDGESSVAEQLASIIEVFSFRFKLDAAMAANRERVFMAAADKSTSVKRASNSGLHRPITSRVMLTACPKVFFGSTGEDNFCCAITLAFTPGVNIPATAPPPATGAPKPPKSPPRGAGAAAGGAAGEGGGLLSLRMLTNRELNADWASIMFSREPLGGA